jgi:hypothetical protein
MGKGIRPLVSIALVALTVLGITNVNEDPMRIEHLAIAAACDGCEPFLSGGSANPFQMVFKYKLTTSTEVEVVCRKRFVFLGDYNCAKAVD